MKKLTRLAVILVALIITLSVLTLFPAAEGFNVPDTYQTSASPDTADTLISVSTVIAAFGILGFVVITRRKH